MTTTPSDLPPLPEPTIEGSVMHPTLNICYSAPLHFTADQMRAYGEACAAHAFELSAGLMECTGKRIVASDIRALISKETAT